MPTGAITEYIDVAQLVLYLFWIFFAGLIYYLHKENKREGYPLESDRSTRVVVQGWPRVPKQKTYLLRGGERAFAPNMKGAFGAVNAVSVGGYPGAPLEPTGNPLLAGVGPGAYADRADVPDLTIEDVPRIVPLRADPRFAAVARDPDPRGKPVIGADGVAGGTVRELWVDRSEALFRYLEVTLAGGTGNVLLPMGFARIERRGVRVASILGAQFADVPRTRHPDQVTFLEEDRICAYYGAGTLYATPGRREALL